MEMMKPGKCTYYFVLLILIMLNCAIQNGTNPTNQEAEALVKETWQQFEAGN
jgi:hypothetical protein